MHIILAAFLAGPALLPQIDRRSLELQARAEALQPESQPPRSTRRIAPRRTSAGDSLNLASITTICRAAGNQVDPAAFLARLSAAYSLSIQDSASLRSSCAAYLAGRADARRTGSTY